MNVSSPRGEGGGKRRLKQTKFQGGKVGAGQAGRRKAGFLILFPGLQSLTGWTLELWRAGG